MRALLPDPLAPGEPGNLEAERMATATANVFGPLTPSLVGRDEVTPYYAGQRVPDYGHPFFCFDEGVSANARVFGSVGSRRHNMDAVAQEPA